MYRMSTKFLPRLVTGGRDENRVNINQELLDQTNVLKNIVTGDETWLYGYAVKTVAVCRPGQKSCTNRLNMNVIVVGFFD